ncbi:MAG: hypothetical protein A2017_16885 [Lentisphaerae bacterium GWF2_44_16]|nr:MAG: hypothetical protein A2017_16885 [Lentisphaerae bacterium GWF2_44_16]HAU66422.1 hypothetical protein [Candidatus Uhrbacteria bacterium]
MQRLRLVSVHGESTGPPVDLIDDGPLERALDSVTKRLVDSTKTYTDKLDWRYVLLRQEREVLFQVLRGRVYTPVRLREAVEFLWMIDPQDKKKGWNDQRLKNYVYQANKTLQFKHWGQNLLSDLQDKITQVKHTTNQTFFRRELLCAALFFFCTGHQEQIPQRATG